MCSSRPFTLAIALSLAALAGCGRGGSSGFDIGENATIRRALETRRCLDFEDLTICPARDTAEPTPTPGGAPSIETDLGDAASIDCFQATPGGSCTFTLRFIAREFPAGTTFKALARADESTNPWVLGADPVLESGTDARIYNAALFLTAPQGGPPTQVQFAVLAFPAAPPSDPPAVQELHQTAATFAFVTQALAVRVVTPPLTPTQTGIPTRTATPTRTPGTSDCCQCPSSCAEPVNGACDSGCTVVFGTTCFGEQLCVLHTPTPSVTPTPIAMPCFRNNADGTVTDECTGLMWEVKDQRDGLHDFSARYPWAGVCDSDRGLLCQPDASAAAACAEATDGAVGCSQCPDGGTCDLSSPSEPQPAATTIWGWLVQLNQGQGFAGHTDWRIPTVGEEDDAAELETILLSMCTAGAPCVPPVFNTNCDPGVLCGPNHPCATGETCIQRPDVPNQTCQATPGCTVENCSCTWTSFHWSATSLATTPGLSWSVEFGSGEHVELSKRWSWASVRAVRGTKLSPPTPTPGAQDCCQCESSCAAPVDGSCGSCPVVTGAACDGGTLCAPHTPTATPTPCLQDNGDGTITDGCRGLTWEKKDRAAGVHDYSNLYTWAGACTGNSSLCQPNAGAAAACTQQTGGAVGCSQCATGTCIVDPAHGGAVTTIWDWLSQLNASAFAGYNDWRIPTVGFDGDAPQLETLFAAPNPCSGRSLPCVVPLFDSDCAAGCSLTSCSCTQSDAYWAATTNVTQPGAAWEADFSTAGFGQGAPKTNAYFVRAVRGGS